MTGSAWGEGTSGGGRTAAQVVASHVECRFAKLRCDLGACLVQACWRAALILVVIEEADLAPAVGPVLAFDSAEAVWVQPGLKDAMRVLAAVPLRTEAGVPACTATG